MQSHWKFIKSRTRGERIFKNHSSENVNEPLTLEYLFPQKLEIHGHFQNCGYLNLVISFESPTPPPRSSIDQVLMPEVLFWDPCGDQRIRTFAKLLLCKAHRHGSLCDASTGNSKRAYPSGTEQMVLACSCLWMLSIRKQLLTQEASAGMAGKAELMRWPSAAQTKVQQSSELFSPTIVILHNPHCNVQNARWTPDLPLQLRQEWNI